MNLPTLRLVFDRKKNASKTGKGLVQIEILYQRRRRYIGTGLKLFSYQWSDVDHVVRSSHSLEHNSFLNEVLSRLNSFIRNQIEERGYFSLESIDDFLLEPESISLYDFISNELAIAKLAEGTKKHHQTVIESLQKHGRMRDFNDVTLANIEKWDAFLRKEKREEVTIYGYHKRFRKWVNLAVRRGFLKESPYKRFVPPRGECKPRKYLSMKELDEMQNVELSIPYLENARDLYLFQCYTGLSYKDMANLDYRSCIDVRNGRYVIASQREKTGKNFYVVLLKPALEILKKNDFQLNVPSNQKYNAYIKSVAGACRIRKNLTSHTARHTFAVIALNSGIPVEVVSRILGHTNIRTTQIYARIVDTSVDKAFEHLEEVFSL